MRTERPDLTGNDVEMRARVTLELCFITLIGLAVAIAFIVALSYDFISARAPLVVMVPLLLLIGVQINRTRRQAQACSVVAEFSSAVRGQSGQFNAIAGFICLMILLLLLIYAAGHYVGISVFMLFLLRRLSKESWLLSLAITIGITVIIYLLFEHGFNIELYRGYFFRFLLPY
jgi:hypothetical protein